MFCSRCGKEIADDAAFCKNCGCATKPKKIESPNNQNTNNTLKGVLFIAAGIAVIVIFVILVANQL